MIRVGLIGYGGIAKTLLRHLTTASEGKAEVVGVLCKPGRQATAQEAVGIEVPVVERLEDLLVLSPGIVSECAGHAAVREFGEAVLQSGTDLMIISIGALADAKLHDRLKDAAKQSDRQILLPAGAIGAVDALVAARLSGLTKVRYCSRKPPGAWLGTLAESVCDLDHLKEATVFYRGTAREAALHYPKNANVAATVALAGLGFDKTEVELCADPHTSRNTHEIEVCAKAGNFQIELEGIPSQENPKTSALTAFSVIRGLANLDAAIAI